ncbi:MAG TPA: asparagine synthase (glutamine-hydrolyzing) [Ignavibacteriaceae bacterium]|nr:asparagine synthase (glutamine-hydrolyzing) [Ignavibacteriaceae bacterium]
MCGIAGIFKNITDQDSVIIKTMVHLLRHRGPEETGLYIDDHIALAHARLSIIDLSQGAQPIHNENKTLWIIFNGEIFNYPDLRTELIKSGHTFYTNTDTEVIIHLYEEYGARCLERLNGQFAFAIWDSKTRSLFLARDRMGIVPLFYSKRNGVFSFASEIKALFADPSLEREIDKKALNQIFTFWAALPGRTFFDGINELPPAHYLLVSTQDFIIKKYWHFNFAVENNYKSEGKKELAEQVEETLVDAVRIRLRSDVPVGSYLSGGLDSSGITSIIKNNFNNKLNTFGIRFQDKNFDEGTFQQLMVKFLNVNHSELMVRNEDISSNFETILWHTETPILRTSPVPLFLLSSLVNQHGFKVVLTGEGSDEIFGGYNIFKETKIRKFWSRYPDSKFRPLLLGKLYPYIFKDKRLANTIVEFFRTGINSPGNPLFSHFIRWNNTSKIKNFFSEDLKNESDKYDVYSDVLDQLPREFYNWDSFEKAQYLEIVIFMSSYLLSSQGDRMAMANSVETRLPFLDHRLVELMGTVDPEYKMNLLNEKFILKEAIKNILPDEIVKRPKNPYRAPIKLALMDSNAGLIEKYLSETAFLKTGLFDSRKVDFFLKKMKKTDTISEIDAMTLSGLLSTQIIYDKFITSFSKNYNNIHPFGLVFDARTNVTLNKESI